MRPFRLSPNLTLVPRGAWGAKTTLPRLGHIVPREKRTEVFIHHTVTVDNDASKNIWETEAEIFAKMRYLQTCRPDLGLDVPYNFVAFMTECNQGLYLCEGRGEDRTGAHSVNHNTAGIGIAFAGNFEGDISPQDVAKRMPHLSLFLRWLKYSASFPGYGVYTPMKNLGSNRPANREVFTHRDIKATACPGALIVEQVSKIKFIEVKK